MKINVGIVVACLLRVNQMLLEIKVKR